MRHVLEHLLDPVSALQIVKKSLAENGILYIAVPNNMKPSGSLEKHWFRVVHTYYFNSATLRGVVAKSGLETILTREGDDFGPNELFSFIKKGDGNSAAYSPSSSNFMEQIKVLHDHKVQNLKDLTLRGRFDKRVKSIVRKIIKKLRSFG